MEIGKEFINVDNVRRDLLAQTQPSKNRRLQLIPLVYNLLSYSRQLIRPPWK